MWNLAGAGGSIEMSFWERPDSTCAALSAVSGGREVSSMASVFAPAGGCCPWPDAKQAAAARFAANMPTEPACTHRMRRLPGVFPLPLSRSSRAVTSAAPRQPDSQGGALMASAPFPPHPKEHQHCKVRTGGNGSKS